MNWIQRLRPRPAPNRYPLLSPYTIKRSDRCINCGTCITACLYNCHERSQTDIRKMADPKSNFCRNCFACILSCPRGALSMHPNEDFYAQGDKTYTPAIIRSIQEQAAEGKIPVSGAGYGGAFGGEGYEGIWFDMSEIVRPTRDGIHGREHISTTVYLGRKVTELCGMLFDSQGNLKSPIPPNRGIPIPILFSLPPFPTNGNIINALSIAADKLNTYLTMRAEDEPQRFMEYFNHFAVRLKPTDIERYRKIIEWATIIELEPDGDQIEAILRAREINPHLLTIVRVKAATGVENEILRLAQNGGETIHLSADVHGRGEGNTTLLDCLRKSHLLLVEHGIRDCITLLASGGVAVAEHVPKTIAVGADAVVIDVPLFIALECTVCGKCQNGEECPRKINEINSKWGAARVLNLMVSWRDQLLEVLGAMGMRDVRRLRGETGRAMFAEHTKNEFLQRLKQPTPMEEKICVESPCESDAANALDSRSPNFAPSRFPFNVSTYRVIVDRARCTDCGLCAQSCRYNVHRRTDGKLFLDEPHHERCIGDSCLENDWCCVNVCPWDALKIEKNPVDAVLGDRRWTAPMLRETWRQAQTGKLNSKDSTGQTGDSGGGFDLLGWVKPTNQDQKVLSVDLSIPLNKRSFGPKISIPIPIYGGGMSYGSISLQTMVGRAMAAKELSTFTSTGEGGYPDDLIPYADHVITQIATGLFGVREETIMRARFIEFKYAQGAKPGLGGHLLADKNTPMVAQMREAVPHTALFSPFPFHSVYSVEDHKKHVDWVRAIHPNVLVSVKVSTPVDVDMVAVGSYYAGANIIHLDGGYGGTGAAPDIAKKNIAQPIEYATAQVHDFLVKEGIRDEVVLMVSGGIRTPDDVLKSIALGTDGAIIGTAELVAIGCVRCGNCERNRGCPNGIATTDPELSVQLTSEWVRDRIVNMYLSWAKYMQKRLASFGMKSIKELRGRRDLLEYVGRDRIQSENRGGLKR